MADGDEVLAVWTLLGGGRLRVLKNDQLNPGPVAVDLFVAEALVVRLGEELEAADPADGLGVEGLGVSVCDRWRTCLTTNRRLEPYLGPDFDVMRPNTFLFRVLNRITVVVNGAGLRRERLQSLDGSSGEVVETVVNAHVDAWISNRFE